MISRMLATAALLLALAPISAQADSGFYIGGSAGGATVEANIGDSGIPGLPSSIDEDDTAYKLFAGYNFDLPVVDLAIEGGYVNFGEPDIDFTGDLLLIETTGLNLWGVVALDAGPIRLFGKLGMIAWDAKASFQGLSDSDDGTDIGYGLGAGFNLGPVQIRGEYELYDLDDADLSMLSLGIAYQFN